MSNMASHPYRVYNSVIFNVYKAMQPLALSNSVVSDSVPVAFLSTSVAEQRY